MKKKKVLKIVRAKWRRGGPGVNPEHGLTRLLNEKGMSCCLGFDALACGLTKEQIYGAIDPESVADRNLCALPDEYIATRLTLRGNGIRYWAQVSAVNNAVAHNDDAGLSDSDRERLVREDLIALGWDDVVFV